MIEQIIHNLFSLFIYPYVNHLIHNISIIESNATGVNMTWFKTTLYGGIGFFVIMGLIMLVVNLKTRHELNKPDSENQKQ